MNFLIGIRAVQGKALQDMFHVKPFKKFHKIFKISIDKLQLWNYI